MTKEVPRTSVLRDEELSISDATLIARLRELGDHASFEPHMHHKAADRIEALTKERDSLLVGHRALNVGGARLQDRAETAEAKLAENEVRLGKAVEALRSTLNFIENTEGEMGVILGCGDKARATLAEIKGESHE